MTLLVVNLLLASCSCAAIYVEWRLIRFRIRERAKVQARLAAAAGVYHQLVGGPQDGMEIPAEVSQRLIRVKYFQPPEDLDCEVPAGFGLIPLHANRAAVYLRSPQDVGQPGPCLYHFSGIDVLQEGGE